MIAFAVANELPIDSWMARLINGLEVPDPSLSGNGVQGCGAGYDGVRWNGMSKMFMVLQPHEYMALALYISAFRRARVRR
jgi:hypothetical protein